MLSGWTRAVDTAVCEKALSAVLVACLTGEDVSAADSRIALLVALGLGFLLGLVAAPTASCVVGLRELAVGCFCRCRSNGGSRSSARIAEAARSRKSWEAGRAESRPSRFSDVCPVY